MCNQGLIAGCTALVERLTDVASLMWCRCYNRTCSSRLRSIDRPPHKRRAAQHGCARMCLRCMLFALVPIMLKRAVETSMSLCVQVRGWDDWKSGELKP